MTRSIGCSVAVAAVLAFLTGCGEHAPGSAPTEDAGADVAAIEALLDRVEQSFNAGDLEEAVSVFADDAVLLGQGEAAIVGAEAIRAVYADMLEQFDAYTEFSTEEIEVFGDFAYERGTYTLRLTQKATGDVVADAGYRHIHVFKREPDGTWKTWRLMANSAAAP